LGQECNLLVGTLLVKTNRERSPLNCNSKLISKVVRTRALLQEFTALQAERCWDEELDVKEMNSHERGENYMSGASSHALFARCLMIT
jgi:hypothetical protein